MVMDEIDTCITTNVFKQVKFLSISVNCSIAFVVG